MFDIKVKEPEKNIKKPKTSENKENKKNNGQSADIRKYFPDLDPSKNTNKTKPTETITSNVKNTQNTVKNIHDNINKTQMDNSNVKTMKDLKGGNTRGRPNSSSTITVTKNSSNNDNETSYKPILMNQTNVLQKTVDNKMNMQETNENYTRDFISVRNIWQNKFNTSTNSNNKGKQDSVRKTKKRTSDTTLEQPKSPKIPKITPNTESVDLITSHVASSSSFVDFTRCPVCDVEIAMVDLNDHLDLCLDKSIDSKEVSNHKDVKNESHHDVIKPSDNDLTLDGSTNNTKIKNGVMSNSIEDDSKECPLCNKEVPSSVFDTHLEKCLLKIYDRAENIFVEETKPNSNKDGNINNKDTKETISCLSCDKQIAREDLNRHLDECMSGIFDVGNTENWNDDNSDGSKVSDVNQETVSSSDLYNCPYCLTVVDERLMKKHLDMCLNLDEER